MTQNPQLPVVLQGLLEQIYDVPVSCDIADFLVTDRRVVELLEQDQNARDISEKLLVREDGEHLDLTLFLDADVLRRLHDRDPIADLRDENLSDFWLVVEGISHFLYLAWNAKHDKSVTLLELEMQGEVDKFIVALHVLGRQGCDNKTDVVHRCLFDLTRFHSDLDGEHLARYRHASRYAGKYCKSLYGRFIKKHARRPGLLAELRRFYRLPQSAKIRHIDATAVPAS